MCKNNNCPMYGGACGMKTMDGKANLMVCADYVDDMQEASVFTLTCVVIHKNGALVVHTDTYATESAAVQNMMKDYYGQRAIVSTPTDCQVKRHSAQFKEPNGVIHVWNIEQATVRFERPQPEIRNGEIRVATPIGTLVARDQGNPDYPGIMVDLECNCDGEPENIGIANIEWGVCDDQSRRICASLFRDMTVDDCTDYLAYKGCEESLSHDVPAVFIGVMKNGTERQTGCKVDVNNGVIHNIIDSKVCSNASKAYVLINGTKYPAYQRDSQNAHGQNGLEFVFDS